MSLDNIKCIWCGFDKETHTEFGWNKHQDDKKILYDSPLIMEHPPQKCVDCGIYHTSYLLQNKLLLGENEK